ncbi:Splicing factor 3B subunit 5 [Xenotaenia resolanae]|uniref:Splicing factor 3B subunit 5 n=2 Tax=Goodeidae TaxID=28758 RepID=A0ABV0VLY6_9TELE
MSGIFGLKELFYLKVSVPAEGTLAVSFVLANTVGLISARMTDRYNIHSQLEHLQSKYIGTGHADTSKWEWLVNQHRDSYCSYMGHFDLLNYFSVAENESKARVRFNLMEKMLQPCGPPADKPDDA